MSFYRRPLPPEQVAFAGPEGRRLFREALAEGHMEGWFALAEQFHTQSEPAFCGLGTLVVALNALAIDPGRAWKGPWRWYGEEMLDCCVSLETVKRTGLTLDQVACLARCNGARATVTRASDTDVAAFRKMLDDITADPAAGVLAVGYSRRLLGQTGDGHYSPIGGYHAARDLALVLDVARFKYPPHWVPVPTLFTAMRAVDPDTGRARGWLHLARGAHVRPSFLRITSVPDAWDEVLHALGEAVRAALTSARPASPSEVAHVILGALPSTFTDALVLQSGPELEPAHAAHVAEIRQALAATPLRALVPDDLAAMTLFVLPAGCLDALPPEPRRAFEALRDPAALAPALADEVLSLRLQVADLMAHYCAA